MQNSGFIVILAFPDTIVRVANGEFSSKIWPLLGVGGKNTVRAGHAALLLVSKKTNQIQYFDFGRYITSDTFGRVRSAETDYELDFPFEAKHYGNSILNVKEILLWLEKHPEKTHGDGRMIATVNSEIDFEMAINYIHKLQNQIEVPYGAFIKNGSNCARFVADTLIASTSNKAVQKQLNKTYRITPSPITNVLRGKSDKTEVFEVFQQKINVYTNTCIAKEHWECFFKKISQEINDVGTIKPSEIVISETAQWLGGIGSGAWFELHEISGLNFGEFRIVRYCARGTIQLDAIFKTQEKTFQPKKSFQFLHGSNGKHCFLKQNEAVFRFDFIKRL